MHQSTSSHGKASRSLGTPGEPLYTVGPSKPSKTAPTIKGEESRPQKILLHRPGSNIPHLPPVRQRLSLPHRPTQSYEEVQQPELTQPDAAIVSRDGRRPTTTRLGFDCMFTLRNVSRGFIGGTFVTDTGRLGFAWLDE